MNNPSASVRPLHGRRIHGTMAQLGMVLAALALALVPVSTTLAVGPIWLPTTQATHTSFDNIHPVMATYRNDAFILTTRDTGAATEQVYFTTNASGAWTTRLLSAHGPGAAYGAQWTAMAIDPSINRLYAAWVRPPTTSLGPASLWMWTSDDAGSTWHGPTTIATGQFSEPPDIVAAHGKAYVAFTAAPEKQTAACDDTTSRTADVMLSTFAGGRWSSPRNLTSCVAGAEALSFDGPKLALDESSGHLYLVSDSQESNLWYMDNAAGSWSTPRRIVTAMDDLGQSYGGYRYDYRIAITAGTVYVVYDDRAPGHAATPYGYHDVFLAIHPKGGSWTLQRVTQDPNNCVKAQVALVARAGRLGLAFITFGGAACAGSSGPTYALPQVWTGTPGHWSVGALEVPAGNNCTSPALSSDGDIFRLLVVCGGAGGNANPHADLYYTPEFLDVVGPTITQFVVPATATPPSVTLRWSAQDPTPGSGVAYYELQVSDNGGPEQTVVAATRSRFLIYTHLAAGHRYTFRLRARDRVNNWGGWVSATTQAR